MNSTTVANNSSVVVGSTGGRPLVGSVEQGPAWLARALYGGDGGLDLAVAGTAVIVLVVAAVALHRRGLDEEAVAEARENVAMALGALVATWVLAEHASLPYVADVLLGGLGGTQLGALALRVVLDVRDGPEEPSGS